MENGIKEYRKDVMINYAPSSRSIGNRSDWFTDFSFHCQVCDAVL